MHNFIQTTRNANNFRKGFLIDPFDEPTFLTFSIDFNLDTEPKNVGYEDSKLWESPLFNAGRKWGAINFLNSRSYAAQANSLATFREILRYLTFQAPWYFQSISGLNKLRSQARDVTKGYKTKDIALTIGTLEAVDLRIQELAELYTHSIYDLTYRRERVPDNLRWFSMDIYIAEFRNLRWRIPGLGGTSNTITGALGINNAAIGNIGSTLSGGNILEQYGYIKYKCRQCEFDFSSTQPFDDKLDIGAKPQMASNKFNIKIGWFEEEYKFGDGTKIFAEPEKTEIENPWGTRFTGANAQNIGGFLTGLPIVGDDISRAGQRGLSYLSQIGGLINPTLEAAARFVNGADTWDQVINNRIDLGDRYDKGYATNGDEIPTKSLGKNLLGEAYAPQLGSDLYQESADPKRPPAADVYSIGYATNGDRVPSRAEVVDRNIYPDPVNLSTTPEGSIYVSDPEPENEPDGSVYQGPINYQPEPNGDVYNGPINYPAEPNGDVYQGPVNYPAEPDGDVYTGTVNYPAEPNQNAYPASSQIQTPPSGQVYAGQDQVTPPPAGDVYSNQVNIIPPPGGNIYPVYNPISQPLIGRVYDRPAGPGKEPNGDVYPDTNENLTEPDQNVYPKVKTSKKEPDGDVYP